MSSAVQTIPQEDFVEPVWTEPLDVDTLIAATPEEAMAKGMFFMGPIEMVYKATGEKPGRDRYIPFKDYPVREHMKVLVECAQGCYPNRPLRQALRELGGEAFPAFAESMLGKVIYSVAGRSWDAAFRLAGKSYDVAGNLSSFETLEFTDKWATAHLRGMWNFIDCYHVGVLEGAMRAFGKTGGKVAIHSLGPDEAKFLISWD